MKKYLHGWRAWVLAVASFLALSVVSTTAAALALLLGVVGWVLAVVYQFGVASGFERGTIFGQELCDVAPEYRFDTPPMPVVVERLDPAPSYREAIARYAPADEDIHS